MSTVQPARKVFIGGGKPHLAFGRMMTAVCWCYPAKDKDMLKKCLFKARQLSKHVVWEGVGISQMHYLSLGAISMKSLTTRFQAWGL